MIVLIYYSQRAKQTPKYVKFKEIYYDSHQALIQSLPRFRTYVFDLCSHVCRKRLFNR